MASDSLKAFYEALKSDVMLKERFRSAEDVTAASKIANEAGYAISVEDFEAQNEITETLFSIGRLRIWRVLKIWWS